MSNTRKAKKGNPRSGSRTLFGPRVQLGLGASLTAIAGCVDAIGYLALGGLFASFMSGASISLGVAMTEGHWGNVFEGAALISVFLAGTIGATILSGLTGLWALPITLLVEGGFLAGAAVMAWTGWDASISILPVVTAMGVQNTILRPLDGVRLGVTFMTGTLVGLGEGLGRALLGRGSVRNWYPQAMLWSAFCAGAALGALLYGTFGFRAVSAPAAMIVGIAGIVLAATLFKWLRRTLRMRRHEAPDVR